MSEILATNKELSKIIDNAVKRIGENHSLSRDSKGVEMNAMEIEKDRLKFRKDRISESAVVKERGTTIDNALKEAADEIAEKMLLENTIGGMVKDVISEQDKKKLNILQKFDKFIQSTTMKNLAKKLASPDISMEDWREAMEAYKHAEGRVEDLEDITPEDYTTYKSDHMRELEKGKWYGDPNTQGQGLVEQELTEQEWSNRGFAWFGRAHHEGDDVTLTLDLIHSPTESMTASKKMHQIKVVVGKDDIEKGYDEIKKKADDYTEQKGDDNSRTFRLPVPSLEDFTVSEKKERGKEEDVQMMESTRNTIKKLVKKKLEEGWSAKSMPGYEKYLEVEKDNSKIHKEYEKEFKKKFEDYADFEGNDKPEFPHSENSRSSEGYEKYENTTDDEEFVDDFAYPGLQDFDVHNQDMDRLSKYLEGSSETGNAQTNEKGEALGNVVPSDLGKKILKSKKRRKEKIDAEKASMTSLRRYTPDVQKVKQVKEDVKIDIKDMKKLWGYNKKTQ